MLRIRGKYANKSREYSNNGTCTWSADRKSVIQTQGSPTSLTVHTMRRVTGNLRIPRPSDRPRRSRCDDVRSNHQGPDQAPPTVTRNTKSSSSATLGSERDGLLPCRTTLQEFSKYSGSPREIGEGVETIYVDEQPLPLESNSINTVGRQVFQAYSWTRGILAKNAQNSNRLQKVRRPFKPTERKPKPRSRRPCPPECSFGRSGSGAGGVIRIGRAYENSRVGCEDGGF